MRKEMIMKLRVYLLLSGINDLKNETNTCMMTGIGDRSQPWM